MKIAFFTEMNFRGMVPMDHENMRTEFAWMAALNAYHYNINAVPSEQYDLGIVILPKKSPEQFEINKLKKYCKQVAVMQEGPNWYYQDYSVENQMKYLEQLINADIVYCHNIADCRYYRGLLNSENVFVMNTLMITDMIDTGKLCKPADRDNAIIGGNFCSWYSGIDSYMIAQEFNTKIYAPKMGRMPDNEKLIDDLNHLDYKDWLSWIYDLSKFKYAVHLMRTHAAGTFALNCAYLGIPCIGYEGLDTQFMCHPELTVNMGDLEAARALAKLLATDEDFYGECSKNAQELYTKYYGVDKFMYLFDNSIN